MSFPIRINDDLLIFFHFTNNATCLKTAQVWRGSRKNIPQLFKRVPVSSDTHAPSKPPFLGAELN